MLTRNEWITKYYPTVRSLTTGTGIFPQVMMAQAIIESQAQIEGTWYPAQTNLAANYNNIFGIKADSSWKGNIINLPTVEIQNGQKVTVTSRFRSYNTVDDSFRDYITFLKSNKRYSDYGVFNSQTIEEQATRIMKAGYATGLNYASLIVDVARGIKFDNTTGLLVLAAALLLLNN